MPPPADREAPDRQPYDLTIAEAAAALRDGSLSALALTESVLARIEETEPALNAYMLVTADLAREQAARADEELASGLDRGPLHGIPFALKDLFDTAGIVTTGGSDFKERRAMGLVAVPDFLILVERILEVPLRRVSEEHEQVTEELVAAQSNEGPVEQIEDRPRSRRLRLTEAEREAAQEGPSSIHIVVELPGLDDPVEVSDGSEPCHAGKSRRLLDLGLGAEALSAGSSPQVFMPGL